MTKWHHEIQLTATALWLVLAGNVFSQEIEARVVHVKDGDTIVVAYLNGSQETIRLRGVDAPELKQAHGRKALSALTSHLYGQTAFLDGFGTDRYGRRIADAYVEGYWVNQAMIRTGHAWHYKDFSTDRRLAKAELRARRQQVGLWAGATPIAPWDYRARAKTRR
jgi:micrococcal nuclease